MSAVRSVHGDSPKPDFRARLLDMDIVELLEAAFMALSTLLVFSFNYDTEGIGNTVTNASIACFIFLEVLACVSRRSVEFHPTVIMFSAFTWFCLCSVFWSASFDISFSRAVSLLLMLAYFIALTNFVLAHHASRDRFRFFARILVVSSLFASAYLLLTSGWQTGDRVSGVIGDANQASAYIGYTIPIALYCVTNKLLPKWLVTADVALILFAVGVMGSRTGLLTAVLGIAIYWIIRSNQRGIISLRTLATLIVLAVGVYLISQFIMSNPVAYKLIGSRFESLIDIVQGGSSKINENSYYERQELLALAVQLFSQHPIIGVGIDAYAYYAGAIIRNTFCHNDYLQLLSCVGIIGFCLYYSQHVYIISRFKHLKFQDLALGITLMVQLLFFHVSVVFYYQKLEFVFIAFFVALISTNARNH